jgi:DNA repair protein RecN (Recombination protein N)
MLVQLEIKNYAIIQHVLIEFNKGLNIITGETGAGKSILLGALGLSLGERADSKVLYEQTEKCVIEASFDIKNYALQALFQELDLDYDDKTIVRREISSQGKSRAFINDSPVTLETLKILAEKLVNLTSQNESQQLHTEAYPIELLDICANNALLLQEYKSSFQVLKKTKTQLENLIQEQQKIQKDFDYLSFQLQEIEEAQLDNENLELLEQELNTLSNAELIQSISCLLWLLL